MIEISIIKLKFSRNILSVSTHRAVIQRGPGIHFKLAANRNLYKALVLAAWELQDWRTHGKQLRFCTVKGQDWWRSSVSCSGDSRILKMPQRAPGVEWSHPEPTWQAVCAAVMTVLALWGQIISEWAPDIVHWVICTVTFWFCFHLLVTVFWFFPLLIRSMKLFFLFNKSHHLRSFGP